jgi:hypothetical protein
MYIVDGDGGGGGTRSSALSHLETINSTGDKVDPFPRSPLLYGNGRDQFNEEKTHETGAAAMALIGCLLGSRAFR